MESEQVCEHISKITALKKPKDYICEECIKTGDEWMHLRTCQTCGATLCCDSSPNMHMSKHYHSTKHPVIISAEPGERWMWCYKDEIIADY
jgi:uncharacterized UBP type Zn finger protein